MPIQLLLFSATYQFFKLHFSGDWHVAIEPNSGVWHVGKNLKRLAVSINNAHSCPKKL
jgi:hypothetical protein